MRSILSILCGCLLFGAAVAGEPVGARLKFAETNCDFGDVPRKGGNLVHDFVFTNDGDAPLVLTRVITSCSCIKASFSKRPVAPGGTGTVRIVYEPHKSEPGTFNKVIRVCSNAPSGQEVITVQGNSIEEGQLRGTRERN